MTPAPVAPERLLHELADLWTNLGKDGDAGVLRACTMTLIVVANESDDPVSLGETVAALMPEHPSRAIVVRVHQDPARAMDARVYAQCWMPFGQRRQICCEQIEITAPESSLAEVGALLLPLAAPDLPAVLWCREPRLLDRRGFPELSAVAGKLILDSSAFPDAVTGLRRAAALLAAGRRAGDLSWTRMTPWRELISRIFENRERLAKLAGISGIKIRHGADSPPSWCWYLAAWVSDALRSAGANPALEITRAGSAGANLVGSVELTGSLHVCATRAGDAVVVEVDSLVSRTLLPRPTDYSLLREELGITARDPVFEKTLAAAAGLAVSSTAR